MSKCYMCDEEGITIEHVPPRCLFPKSKEVDGDNLRKNLITIPSCEEHNNAKSLDDEYLLFILNSHFGNNKVSESQVKGRLTRALDRNPKLASFYSQNNIEVEIDDEKSIAFQIDLDRFNSSMEHIAKGLYYHTFGEKLSMEIMTYTPALFALSNPDGNKILKETQDMISICDYLLDEVDTPHLGDNPEVFSYRIFRDLDRNCLILRMTFFEGFHVVCATLHPNSNSLKK